MAKDLHRRPVRDTDKAPDGGHVLYRFFGHRGDLLYVGISLSLAARMSAHRSTQAWWQEVSKIGLDHFPDRKSALQAEAHAIRNERPKYNKSLGITPPPDARRPNGYPAVAPELTDAPPRRDPDDLRWYSASDM